MQKHILDHRTPRSGLTLGRLVAVRRKSMPSKASLMLQRRPRGRVPAMRNRFFLRLASD